MAAAGRWRAGLALLAVLLGLGGTAAEQTEEHLKREHSLSKPYQGVGSASSGLWDLLGNAMVMTQFIRLTPDVQSKQGAVWNRVPCYLRDWEMQVHFKIHGQGKKNLNGDGFAIWYTKDRMQPGPVFGSKDNFLGLGVFVDTYPNEEKQQEAQKRRYSPGNQVLPPAVPPGAPRSHLQEPRQRLHGHGMGARCWAARVPLHLGHGEQRLADLRPRPRRAPHRAGRLHRHGAQPAPRHLPGHPLRQEETHGADRHRRQARVARLHRRARRAPAPRLLLWDLLGHRGPLRQPRHHLAEAVPADGGAHARGGETGPGGFPARGGQPEAAGNGGAPGAHERPGPVPHRLLLAGGPRLRHRHRHHPLQQVAGAEPQALLLTPTPGGPHPHCHPCQGARDP
ncbi:VIP36-like protein isoform X5 [Zonotrichia albicollis]|uniref:VIP36-like protein isoform X5 n=1 Tax=Zonotrichia albicollis TaxID=44394 RepID=UPI003D810032